MRSHVDVPPHQHARYKSSGSQSVTSRSRLDIFIIKRLCQDFLVSCGGISLACSLALLDAALLLRRPILYVKIDGRTHNRDARGAVNCLLPRPPLCHLRAHYSAMMTRGNEAKIRHFFDFSTSAAAVVSTTHANLYCVIYT